MSRELGIEDYEKLCGRTIAFVLAPSAQAGANIYESGHAAAYARVAAVFLMADTSAADDAVEAMRNLQRKGRGALIQAMEFDFAETYGDIEGGDGFRLQELPLNLLQIMRTLAESVLDVYDSLLVIDATQQPPSPEQLYKMTEQLHGLTDAAGAAGAVGAAGASDTADAAGVANATGDAPEAACGTVVTDGPDGRPAMVAMQGPDASPFLVSRTYIEGV